MIIILGICIICEIYATKGVDIAYAFDNFSCFKSNQYEFAIIRAWRSYGAIDPNINTNLKNSKNAGLITDIYMFPCRGKNATSQVNQLIGNLTQVEEQIDIKQVQEEGQYVDQEQGQLGRYRDQGASYGIIWLDVQINPSPGCSWASYSTASNCDYLKQLVNAIKAKGKQPGIYASLYMWQTILGSKNNCASFTSIPIWYAHYDNSPSFSDWSTVSFGGWTKPSIKQYSGDKKLCNADVDFNYY